MAKNIELVNNENEIIYPRTTQDQVLIGVRTLTDKLGEVDEYIKENANNIKKVTDEVSSARVDIYQNEYQTLDERLDDYDRQFELVHFVMPNPSDVATNTANLQKILDVAKDRDIKVKVLFKDGTYELNTCTIYSNTEIEMCENTKLIHVRNQVNNPNTGQLINVQGLFYNAKPFDNESNNITRYNGNGNIKISGGTIEAYCSLIFVHGENIEVKNVKFINSKSDHMAQIGACKNVKFINCEFRGMVEAASNRQYVEMLQIDAMTSSALPYWLSSASIYDETPNDGFLVDGCVFHKGDSTGTNYDYFYTGVGSHGTIPNQNKNIVIRNCRFDAYSYAGVALNNMDYVLVENNTFETKSNANAIRVINSNNVSIRDNHINGGLRCLLMQTSTNINIDGLFAKNLVSSTEYMLIGESSHININNLSLSYCNNGVSNLLLRSSKHCTFSNLTDSNVTGTNFIRATVRDNVECSHISIKNVNSEKVAISKQDAVKNVITDADLYEELWSGIAVAGNVINLSDDFNKFYDHKIALRFFGANELELDFRANSGYCIFKQFNIADTDGDHTINLFEGAVELTDQRTLTVSRLTQLNILQGVSSFVPSPAEIQKVYAKRIRH